MQPILVLITAGSEAEAERLTSALLEQRVVACVNRISGVHSDFWWKGERDQADEVLLMAKSRQDLWPRILETVRSHHSYEVFEALALPIIDGNPDYLQWIQQSTRPSGDPAS